MRLILLGILLSLSNLTYSKESVLGSNLTMQEDLRGRYCSIVNATKSSEQFIALLREMLVIIHNDYSLAISDNKQEQNIQLVKFLDKNFEHLRCTNILGENEKSYMSHIFDTQWYEVLYKDFLYKGLKNDANITVNVNVIIEEDGIPKTPLDIVNERIKNSTNEDIIIALEITRKYITKGLGGVSFKDLPPEDVPDKYK